MDAADIALLRKSLENALASTSDGSIDLLIDLGWADLFEFDPRIATIELFEAQGRCLQTSAALDVIVMTALGRPPVARTAVVHPTLARWDAPPGRVDHSGIASFEGLVLSADRRIDHLLAPFHETSGRLAVASVRPTDADAHPVRGFDPSLRLLAVSGPIDAATPRVAATAPWGVAASTARRALAHEVCALAEPVLDAATAYVGQRHQFGRPVATFQSVRHQLTEVLVALASARSALDASWVSDDGLLLADAAKALAGKAGVLAARHCLQVTGAIGFTEEYGLAPRIRRIYMLDALYGTGAHLQSRIGSSLLASRSVPRFHSIGRR